MKENSSARKIAKGGCRIDGKSRPCDEHPGCGCGPRYYEDEPSSSALPLDRLRQWMEEAADRDGFLYCCECALENGLDYEALKAIIEALTAADALFDFLWNRKETFDPGDEFKEQGFVAVETSEDYDEEEKLALVLGKALGRGDIE